jgi:hypothetical protein
MAERCCICGEARYVNKSLGPALCLGCSGRIRNLDLIEAKRVSVAVWAASLAVESERKRSRQKWRTEELQQLRSLLRTPEETAVLRAALRSYKARKRILKEGLAAFEASTAAEMALFDALDALPPERRDELTKEDKTDDSQ